MPFSFEKQKKGKMSFFCPFSQGNGKLVTTVYCKPTASGVYTHIESF